MNKDKIIAAAREAGFESESWPGGETVVSPAPAGSSITDELARFYAIAYRAGMERAAEICDEVADSWDAHHRVAGVAAKDCARLTREQKEAA